MKVFAQSHFPFFKNLFPQYLLNICKLCKCGWSVYEHLPFPTSKSAFRVMDISWL